MAELSRPVIPADVVSSLHSELGEMEDPSAAAVSVSLDEVMASSPLSSGCLVPSSSVNEAELCQQVAPVTGAVVMSASPTTLAASCSSTPPTPRSHGSESSPGLHSDVAVTVPPPPYPAHGPSADLSAAVTLGSNDTSRSHLPPPPKKPLTPYMRFSKSIWQKVKAANQNFTVCEIGATIGRLWREMPDIDKQQYNDDFAHDKARYDGELQVYLKATGLQASDLSKAKVKKTKSNSSGKGASYSTSPSHGDVAKPVVDSYSTEAVNGSDGMYTANTAVSGLAGGSTLPHFSQVWSSTAQDMVYNADQLLAQMTGGAAQANMYHGGADTAVIQAATDAATGQHLQPTVYHDASSSAVSTSTSQDQASVAAAMTSWLWQQYTAAAAAGGTTTDQQFVAQSVESLPPNAVDAMTDGNVIVYRLNANGSQSAAYSGEVLEPGEVRLPATAAQTNGTSQSATAEYQLGAPAPWSQHAGSTTVDSEKQLLRGALVDKVREIQRLTRELEQAYALIHQLKQHNEFLHRQWGQIHMTPDAAATAQ